MNRGTLLLGAAVIAAMAAYPPWDCMEGMRPHRVRRNSAGYAPIWAPPDQEFRASGLFRNRGCNAEISWGRLGVQVGGVSLLTFALAFSGMKKS